MVSDYVYAEALRALEQGKLVNVRPADMSFRDIPKLFNIHPIDEAEDHARILATIAKVMAGTPVPARMPLREIYFRQHSPHRYTQVFRSPSYRQIPSCPPKSKRYLDGIVRVKRLAGFDYAEGDMN